MVPALSYRSSPRVRFVLCPVAILSNCFIYYCNFVNLGVRIQSLLRRSVSQNSQVAWLSSLLKILKASHGTQCQSHGTTFALFTKPVIESSPTYLELFSIRLPNVPWTLVLVESISPRVGFAQLPSVLFISGLRESNIPCHSFSMQSGFE
jgi:hypothetical protein